MGKRRREKRSIDPFTAMAVNAVNIGPAPTVSARLAENLSAVLACVQAISSACASLPVYVYRWTKDGRQIDDQHPLQRLIRNGPNQHQTWPDFIEWLVAQTLLRGNGFASVTTDTAGQVMALTPYPWEHVNVQLLMNGRLVYDVTDINGIYGGNGQMRRLLQDEVLHIRDRTDDGLIGRSRLQRAGAVVGTAIATQEFAGKNYVNGMWPGGAIQIDQKLTEEQKKTLRDQLAALFSGPANAGRFMILDQGLKWQAASVSPEDAELLASRRFTTEELARLYQVPPPLIGDLTNGTFTNAETTGRWFAQHTLRPWITKLQAQITRAVFSDEQRQTHSIEFDMSDLLRGDPETRWKSHQIAVGSGILTPNEVREVEGWNPLPEGNSLKSTSPRRWV